MKFISPLILVGVLALSWCLANSEDSVSVRTHNDIQVDLVKIIRQVVTEKLPGATDFHFSKLYTETLNPATVEAFFGYTFKDANTEDQTERAVEGTALLTKDPAHENQWVLEEIKVDQAAIEFEKGVVIKAGEEQSL